MSPVDRIAAWLREAAEPLSGAELARRLGCTRAAVWKHIARLRERGWEIDGRHARGYVLVRGAEALDADALGPHLSGGWRRIEWRAQVDSTMHAARALAEAGADEGTVVIAERQSGGRGRLGRTWHSPPGVNLYCTVVMRPPCPPTQVPQLAIIAGLAVADAIRAETGLAAQLKWPNDVLLGGRKVSGILTEMQGELERVRYALVGIGVNVNVTELPPELTSIATSLRLATGRPVDRARFTGRLLAALEARYARFLAGGVAAVRAEWESMSALQGQDVSVTGATAVTRGRVVGLDDDGALVLQHRDGRRVRVMAGEVTLRREGRA